MRRIKAPKEKLLITAAVALFAVVLYFLPVSCPILTLFGVPCPGCGMTRALLSALRLDLRTAFSFHMMFWSVPVLYVCFLYDGRLFKKKWANILLYAVMLLGYGVNWVVKAV